jgi:hypothetical protein
MNDLIVLSRSRGGDCANFIASSIVYLLNEDTVDMDFSDGNSHHYFQNLHLKEEIVPKVIIPFKWVRDTQGLYDYKNTYPERKKILHIYLNDIRDFYLTDCYHFFKMIMFRNPNYKSYLDSNNPKLFQIGLKMSENFIKTNINLEKLDTYLDADPSEVSQLNFHNIRYNPKATMEWLSMVTEKPITKSYKRNYLRYLKIQKNIENKYFPWLPEFLKTLP